MWIVNLGLSRAHPDGGDLPALGRRGGQAEQIPLGTLPTEAAAGLIIARFSDTSLDIDDRTVDEPLAFTGGHPQRTMLVADRSGRPPSRTADGSSTMLAECLRRFLPQP